MSAQVPVEANSNLNLLHACATYFCICNEASTFPFIYFVLHDVWYSLKNQQEYKRRVRKTYQDIMIGSTLKSLEREIYIGGEREDCLVEDSSESNKRNVDRQKKNKKKRKSQRQKRHKIYKIYHDKTACWQLGYIFVVHIYVTASTSFT